MNNQAKATPSNRQETDAKVHNLQTPWITIREAAKYARCSERTLRRANDSGNLKHKYVGGKFIYKKEWVEDWISICNPQKPKKSQ